MVLSCLLFLLIGCVHGQAQTPLSLNSINSFSSETTSVVILPASPTLFLTVALCSPSTSLRFLVSNSSSNVAPAVANGVDVFEVPVSNGYGSWVGPFPDGGALAIRGDQSPVRFEVGLSDQSALHEVLADPPIFGDSTSTEAILFSHPVLRLPNETQSSFPNYTLQPALPSLSIPQDTSLNLSLVIAEATSAIGIPQTACMVVSLGTPANVFFNQTLWSRDRSVWRSQYLVDGLSPATNYSVYVVQNDTKISGPLFFATKSTSFTCPLVHSLPYCPAVSYAVPLPPPPDGSSAYSADNLPATISDPILSYLTNFTVSLSFRCPSKRFNANVTYAEGVGDSDNNGGSDLSQDRYGNVWCNGS
ncbi:hypothetical protein AX16_006159 [Volvariella volvacea WC 439]|nr:hypothetical protein AX16_006159 [Volvariella volvacea WC 439]